MGSGFGGIAAAVFGSSSPHSAPPLCGQVTVDLHNSDVEVEGRRRDSELLITRSLPPGPMVLRHYMRGQGGCPMGVGPPASLSRWVNAVDQEAHSGRSSYHE